MVRVARLRDLRPRVRTVGRLDRARRSGADLRDDLEGHRHSRDGSAGGAQPRRGVSRISGARVEVRADAAEVSRVTKWQRAACEARLALAKTSLFRSTNVSHTRAVSTTT